MGCRDFGSDQDDNPAYEDPDQHERDCGKSRIKGAIASYADLKAHVTNQREVPENSSSTAPQQGGQGPDSTIGHHQVQQAQPRSHQQYRHDLGRHSTAEPM